jgi:hypothetical protein
MLHSGIKSSWTTTSMYYIFIFHQTSFPELVLGFSSTMLYLCSPVYVISVCNKSVIVLHESVSTRVLILPVDGSANSSICHHL